MDILWKFKIIETHWHTFDCSEPTVFPLIK